MIAGKFKADIRSMIIACLTVLIEMQAEKLMVDFFLK